MYSILHVDIYKYKNVLMQNETRYDSTKTLIQIHFFSFALKSIFT